MSSDGIFRGNRKAVGANPSQGYEIDAPAQQQPEETPDASGFSAPIEIPAFNPASRFNAGQMTSGEFRTAKDGMIREQGEQDRIRRASQERNARESAAAAERLRGEQAAAQFKAEKNKREQEFRTRGIENYTDADGMIQPVTNKDGSPVFKEQTGPVEYDRKTGKPFQVNRDKSGALTRVNPDQGAEIGENPDDPTDKYIYRKNKHSAWEAIDPEEGIDSGDAKVVAASAKALHRRELGKVDAEAADVKGQIARLDLDGKQATFLESKKEIAPGVTGLQDWEAVVAQNSTPEPKLKFFGIGTPSVSPEDKIAWEEREEMRKRIVADARQKIQAAGEYRALKERELELDQRKQAIAAGGPGGFLSERRNSRSQNMTPDGLQVAAGQIQSNAQGIQAAAQAKAEEIKAIHEEARRGVTWERAEELKLREAELRAGIEEDGAALDAVNRQGADLNEVAKRKNLNLQREAVAEASPELAEEFDRVAESGGDTRAVLEKAQDAADDKVKAELSKIDLILSDDFDRARQNLRARQRSLEYLPEEFREKAARIADEEAKREFGEIKRQAVEIARKNSTARDERIQRGGKAYDFWKKTEDNASVWHATNRSESEYISLAESYKEAKEIERFKNEENDKFAKELGYQGADDPEFKRDLDDQAKIRFEGKFEKHSSTLLHDGELHINPSLLWDNEGYERAIAESGATDDQKEAVRVRLDLDRQRMLGVMMEVYAGNPEEWKEIKKDYGGDSVSDIEAMQRFISGRGWFNKVTDPVRKGIRAGWADIKSQAYGAGAFALRFMPTEGGQLASEILRQRGQAESEWAGKISQAAQLAGSSGNALDISRGAMSLGPSILPGAVVGGGASLLLKGANAAKAGSTAGFAASIVAAGAQSGGGTYIAATEENYQKIRDQEIENLKKEGLKEPEIKERILADETNLRRRASNESIGATFLSGIITSGVTAIGGRTGVESIFKNPSKFTAWKDGVKRGWLNWARKSAKEGISEAVEEGADQVLQSIAEKLTYNPEKTVEEAVEESLHAAFIGGVLGGGIGAAKSRKEAFEEVEQRKKRAEYASGMADKMPDAMTELKASGMTGGSESVYNAVYKAIQGERLSEQETKLAVNSGLMAEADTPTGLRLTEKGFDEIAAIGPASNNMVRASIGAGAPGDMDLMVAAQEIQSAQSGEIQDNQKFAALAAAQIMAGRADGVTENQARALGVERKNGEWTAIKPKQGEMTRAVVVEGKIIITDEYLSELRQTFPMTARLATMSEATARGKATPGRTENTPNEVSTSPNAPYSVNDDGSKPDGTAQSVSDGSQGRSDGQNSTDPGKRVGTESGAGQSQGGNQSENQSSPVRNGDGPEQPGSADVTPGTPVFEPRPGGNSDVDSADRVLGRSMERISHRLGLPGGTLKISSKGSTAPAVTAHDDGSIEVSYNVTAALAQAWRRNSEDGGHGPKYLSDAFNEELVHVADMLSVREKWRKESQPGSFPEYFKAEREKTLSDIEGEINSGGSDSGALARALIEAAGNYSLAGQDGLADFLKNIPGESDIEKAAAVIAKMRSGNMEMSGRSGGWVLASEFLRSVIQAKRRGDLTETGYRRVAGRLLEWMRSLVEKLKAITGNKVVSGEIKRIEEILDMANADWTAPKNEAKKPRDFKPAQTGSTGTAFTDNNDAVEFEWAVAEAGGLLVSNHDDGSVNPDYPAELQPRDRSSAGSQSQVDDIAKNSNFSRLSESDSVGGGAPIVGPDGVVESGNGRIMGLSRAYTRGLASVNAYRENLADNAERLGMNADSIRKMKNPVLIRIRKTELDRRAFAEAANVANVAPMREIETAKKDAANLTPEIFEIFHASEDGGILGAENRDFIRAFVGEVVPKTERAGVIDGKGGLSQSGLRRIRNALFVSAYGDSPEAINSLQRMAEEIDADGRNITNAMIAAAPVLSRQNAAIQAGRLYDAGISKDVAIAAQTLADLKSSGGNIDAYLRQDQLFSDGVTDFQKNVMTFMDSNARSVKRILAVLNRYANALDAAGDPRQIGFFGDDAPTREALWALASRDPGAENRISSGERNVKAWFKIYNRLFTGGSLSSGQRESMEAAARKLSASLGSGERMRSEMPQIPSGERGALARWLSGTGVGTTIEAVPASELRSSQIDIYPEKVASAREKMRERSRSILVSRDGWVLDGHHQTQALREDGKTVPIVRIDLNREDALRALGAFAKADDKGVGTKYETEEYQYLGKASQDWRKSEHAEAGVVNPIDPSLSPDEKVDALAALSDANIPLVENILKDLGRIGLFGKWSKKLPERIQAKASRPSIRASKPWHDIEHVRDGLRFKVTLDHFNKLPGIARVLADKGVEVIKLDTQKMFHPKEWGWRFVAFDLRMPNGQLVEFYAPVPEMDSKAVKGPNHHLFEKWRNVATEAFGKDSPEQAMHNADIEESNERYDAAFDTALTRMGYKDRAAAEASWMRAVALAESVSRSKNSIPSTAENDPQRQSPDSSRRNEPTPGKYTTASPSSGETETRAFEVEDSLDSDGVIQPDNTPSGENRKSLFSGIRRKGGGPDLFGGDYDLLDLLGDNERGGVQARSFDLFGNALTESKGLRKSNKATTPKNRNETGLRASDGLFSERDQGGFSFDDSGESERAESRAEGIRGEGLGEPGTGHTGGVRGGVSGRRQVRPGGEADLFHAGNKSRGMGDIQADSGENRPGERDGPASGPVSEAPVVGTGRERNRPGNGRTGVLNRPEKGSPERNHVIDPGEKLAQGGAVTRYNNNLTAIRLLRQLEGEKRNPTAEEKQVLARYVGWGGIPQVFDDAKARSFAAGEHETRRNTADSYSRYGAKYAEMVEDFREQADQIENWNEKWGAKHAEIKELLTPDEYDAAAASTTNAHFTSPGVVLSMWDAVRRLGFEGGNVMEPAGGTGNFLGLMPESLADASIMGAVELDSITGRILAKLYPEARVQVTGFQDADIADNSLDLAISNVPFANVSIYDKAMEAAKAPKLSLHNYFFAKALQKVRPGGIIAFITTSNTMDANITQRKWIAGRSELIGAIRLPNTAFSENAGTEVTTDIIFLRKPDGNATGFTPEEWGMVADATTRDGETIQVNEYFARHPEMILGELANDGSMYRRGDQMTVHPFPDKPLSESLREAVSRLPQGVIAGKADTGAVRKGKTAPLEGRKVGVLSVSEDGKVSIAGVSGDSDEPAMKAKNRDIVRSFVALRDAINGLYESELDPEASDADIEGRREKLNRAYDEFVANHGPVHKHGDMLGVDPDYYRLLGAEVEAKPESKGESIRAMLTRKKTYRKGDVFSRRVLRPRSEPDKAESVEDALGISLGWKGRLDSEYISRLTGRSGKDVESEMLDKGIAYRNPETGLLETKEEYLSGNVRRKLRVAEAKAAEDKAYTRNAEELRRVMPDDVKISDIRMRLGSGWIPPHVIEQFAREVLYSRHIEIILHKGIGDLTSDRWEVRYGAHGARVTQGLTPEMTQTYGTADMSALVLMEKALNLHQPEVFSKDSQGNRIANPTATTQAKVAMQKLKDAFNKWVESNPEAQEELAKIYNEENNSHVPRKYDGQFLKLPWVSSDFDLYPDKKDVVWRALQDGRALIAHGVGGGKTIIGTAIAMELKRLGQAKKPMIVVHNATLEQFASTINAMAPTARVLVARKTDLAGVKRKEFMAKIAAGDWDAVVMAHSSFDMIKDSPEYERKILTVLKEELREAIKDSDGEAKAPSVKEMQKQLARLEERIKKTLDRKTDNVLNFQELGVDALILDEVHLYKKTPFVTKLSRIAGIDNGESDKGAGLMVKTRYLQEKNKGRNVFTMTGTPVTNTLGESWSMIRLVAPDLLEEFGVKTFDSFVSKFADIVTSAELRANGSYKRIDRLSALINLPEWTRFFRLAADVKMGVDMKVKGRPEIKGGKPELVAVERTAQVKKFTDFIRGVIDDYDRLSGVKKRELSYLPLLTYSAAKMAAIDIRLINPNAADEPGSKVNTAIKRVLELHKRTSSYLGTQVIFADSFRPLKSTRLDMTGADLESAADADDAADEKDAESGDGFNLYRDIKRKLVASGVPASEVAIISDYNTDTQKDRLFEQVNNGEVRIIIGSTQKLGTGVNMQRRMIAAHHLDVPWTPAELEQRDGRVYRQGNIHSELGVPVEIYRYGMKDTLDAALWQKLETKDRFIKQALSGKISSRSIEDDTGLLNLAEQKAVLSGPLGMKKFEADEKVRDLENEQRAWRATVSKAKESAREAARNVRSAESERTKIEALADKVKGWNVAGADTDKIKETLDSVFNDRLEIVRSVSNPDTSPKVLAPLEGFAYRGAKIELKEAKAIENLGQSNPERRWSLGVTIYADGESIGTAQSPGWVIKRLEEYPASLGARMNKTVWEIDHWTNVQKAATAEISDTFPKQAELDAAYKEQADVLSLAEKKAPEAGGSGFNDANKESASSLSSGNRADPEVSLEFLPTGGILNRDRETVWNSLENFDSRRAGKTAGSVEPAGGSQPQGPASIGDEISAWARLHGRSIRSGEILRIFSEGKQLESGEEHAVVFDKASGRVIKITKPGKYGARGLSAWIINHRQANSLLGDDIRLEGAVEAEPGIVQLVISQPFREGRHSTRDEITAYLKKHGYDRVGDVTYYHSGAETAISDAKEANFITGENGEVYPVDVQFSKPRAATQEMYENIIHGGMYSGGNSLLSGQRYLDFGLYQNPDELDLGGETKSVFDAKDGMGAVPHNQDVDYFGFTLSLTPSQFRSVVPAGVSGDGSKAVILNHLRGGGKIGQPFLDVKWNDSEKVWTVLDHEGRSRSDAFKELFGDVPMETHIFPVGMRARDITPEMRLAPIREQGGKYVLNHAAAQSPGDLVRDNMGLAVEIANDYRNILGAELNDVIQEARLALVRAAQQFDSSKGSFGAYAGKSIRNRLNDMFGRTTKAVYRETLLDTEINEDGDTKKDMLPSPVPDFMPVEQRETQAEIEAVLAKLPERPQQIVRDYMSGRSGSEIAAKLGISRQAVNASLRGALGILKQRLTARGFRGHESGILFSAQRDVDFTSAHPAGIRAAQLMRSGKMEKLPPEESFGVQDARRYAGGSRREVLDAVKSMADAAYARIGGHPFSGKPAEAMLEDDTVFDVLFHEGKPVAFSIIKPTRDGFKSTLSGTDGSNQGVDAWKAYFLRHKEPGYYIEASGKVEGFAFKRSVPTVTADKVGFVTGKKITPLANGIHYERWITGLPKPHVKVMFGLPWRLQKPQNQSLSGTDTAKQTPTQTSSISRFSEASQREHKKTQTSQTNTRRISNTGGPNSPNRSESTEFPPTLPKNGADSQGPSEGSLSSAERELSDELEKLLSELRAGIPSDADIQAMRDKAQGEPAGKRTVGSPHKANYAEDKETRREIDVVHELRKHKFERQRDADLNKEAQDMVHRDADGVKRRLLEGALNGRGLGDAVMVKAAKILVPRLILESTQTGDAKARRDAFTLAWAYDMGGTQDARALAARRDPFKTPAERHMEFLAKVIARIPPEDQREIDKAATPQEKAVKLTQAQDKRIEKIESILKEMGLTFEDIFAPDVQSGILKTAVSRKAVESLKGNTKRAARYIMDGFSDKEIAKALKLKPGDIEQARKEFDAALDREIDAFLDRDLSDEAFAAVSALLSAARKFSKEQRDKIKARLKRQIRPDADKANAKRRPPKRRKPPTPPSATPEEKEHDRKEPSVFFPRFDPGDRYQVAQIARHLVRADAGAFDKAGEYWVNSILSGPQTQAVNVIGNGFSMIWEYAAHRPLESIVGKLMGARNATKWGELGIIYKALVPSISRAMKDAVKTWAPEKDFLSEDYLDTQAALNLQIEQYSRGAIGGRTGRVIRVPGRVLMLADTFFKSLTMNAEVAAQAYRLGIAQGLKTEALQKFIQSEMAPGSLSWNKAYDKALEMTFQKELPAWVQKVSQWINAPQGAGLGEKLASFVTMLFFPFIKTPYNIIATGLRKSPLGIFNMAFRGGEDLAAAAKGRGIGSKYKREEVAAHVAEQLVAWAMAGALLFAAEGDDDDDDKWLLITGGRNSTGDKAGERDLQVRKHGGSYQIRIGGIVIPYGRIEPLATVLGTTVDAIRTGKRDGFNGDLPFKTAGLVAQQAREKTFLSGFASIMDALDAADDPKKARQSFLRTFGSGLVPNILRQPVRNWDEVVRDGKFGGAAYTMMPSAGNAEARHDLYGARMTKSSTAPARVILPSGVKTNAHLGDTLLESWARKSPGEAYFPRRPGSDWYQIKNARGEITELTPRQVSDLDRMAGTMFDRKLKSWLTPEKAKNPTADDVKRYEKDLSEARSQAKKAFDFVVSKLATSP